MNGSHSDLVQDQCSELRTKSVRILSSDDFGPGGSREAGEIMVRLRPTKVGPKDVSIKDLE
jgi:hypothetical protein